MLGPNNVPQNNGLCPLFTLFCENSEITDFQKVRYSSQNMVENLDSIKSLASSFSLFLQKKCPNKNIPSKLSDVFSSAVVFRQYCPIKPYFHYQKVRYFTHFVKI